MRGTLHVLTRELYPYLEAAHIESQSGRHPRARSRPRRARVRLAGRAAGDPARPVRSAAALLGTDDRWTVEFALRAMPFVRTAPIGAWPHNPPSPFGALAGAAGVAAKRALRASSATISPRTGRRPRRTSSSSPASGFGQIDPALDGLRTFADEQAGSLRPAARAARGGRRAGAGALPAAVRLGDPRAPRSVADPAAPYRDTVIRQEERDDAARRSPSTASSPARGGSSRPEARRRRAVRAAAARVPPRGRRRRASGWPRSTRASRTASARARARRAAPRGRPRRRRSRVSRRARPPAA